MFGKKNTSSEQHAKNMGNAPNVAFEKAQERFLEAHGSPKVEASRLFLLLVISIILNIALGLAINSLYPLKTYVPYSVVLSQDKSVSAQVIEAKKFNPDENVKIFFLSSFIENMLTIDPYQTKDNLKKALAVTRDKATKEFTDFVEEDQPINRLKRESNLIRTVKFITVNPGGSENIAFVRVKQTERAELKVTEKIYMYTIHYAVMPPTDAEMIYKNPVGIYITHFDRREEINN